MKMPSDETRKLLVLRAALMCSLILSCWAITYDMSFRSNYLTLFIISGPIAAGFYAGASSSRGSLSALYVCLGAALAVTAIWSALLYLLYGNEDVSITPRTQKLSWT